MKIKYVTKQVEISEKLTNLINKKVSKLDKYFKKEPDVCVTLSKVRNAERLELMVSASGTLFRSEVEGPSFYHDIDDAIEVIERQIRKNKGRLEKKMKDSFVAPTYEVEDPYEDAPEFVVKKKKFDLRPMTVEEAIMQMNLLGHEFFVFVD
jgi:putative sigma-54 modulation protein